MDDLFRKHVVPGESNVHKEFHRWKRTDDYRKWRKKQFLKQGGLCWYCGDFLPMTRQNVEHKTARSRGGRNNKNNLVLACSPCNRVKGSRALTVQERTKYNKQNRHGKGTYLKNKQLYGQYGESTIIELLRNLALET